MVIALGGGWSALDIVDVFRRSEHVQDHLEDILAAAPGVLWMQDGVAHASVAEAGLAQ